jgi:dihydropyrimidinase
MEQLPVLALQHYLAVGGILFVIGLVGFLTRRNLIVLFLCTELMFQGVADGRLSLQQMVEATAAAPARLFGLAPRKGSIAVGADADLVILDPSRTTRLSAATHHMRVDYDLFEGREVRGAIDTVLSRGEIVIHAGRFEGAAGRGRFLPRSAGV